MIAALSLRGALSPNVLIQKNKCWVLTSLSLLSMTIAALLLLLAITSSAFAYIKLLPPLVTINVTIGKRAPLKLELATTPKTREHGLMHRSQLSPLDGMLFQFPAEQPQAFWMKNTVIPLDIIFINSQHRIVRIAANATPHSLVPIPSGEPVIAVIEIDGGRTKRDGITVGEKVDYEIPATVIVE